MNGGCTSINVPLHGYLTERSYGSGWACERGYRESGDSCVVVEMPENAHLNFSGNDWDCNKPFSKRSDRCVPPLTK